MSIDAQDFDLLIARAINSAKATHLPTYAALRLLLKSGEHYRPVLTSFTNRRSLNRDAWRFLPFQILKEVSTDNGVDYRDCFAGSPLTILAESMILKLMSDEPSFAVPACAYSYLWPEFRLTGKNFSFYFDGYQKRNRRATELINNGSGNIAIIMDIKKFYPTIDREKLKEKVADRVSSFRDIDDRRRVTQFVSRYLSMDSFGERGIAIGPDLSHALGHLALEDVDKAAMIRFGDRYLRYVDDIIVIAQESEAGAVFDFMSELLSREDLRPNEAKTDYVRQATWLRDNDLSSQAGIAEPFNALFDGITLYLIGKPDNASSLQSMFRKEGFSIPMGRLQSRAKSSRFRAYLNGKVGVVAWLFRWLWLNEKYLLTKAKAVREQYLGRMALTLLASVLDFKSSGLRTRHV